MNVSRSLTMAALGAATMYLWDPRRGRRRRARVRGSFDHAVHASIHGLDIASRDLANRVHGVIVTRRGERPDDDVLTERVRAKLGRLSSRPHAICAKCESGRILLTGQVLEAEAPHVVSGVRAVPGVVAVDDRLDRHASADTPALQDAVARHETARLAIATYWSPGTRLLAGAAGTLLAAYGAGRRGPVGVLQALIGGALLARSVTNASLGALVGIGSHKRSIAITKTLTIHTGREHAFSVFTAFENFPRFMRNVRDVKKVGDNRWHWKVKGPFGVPFEWDAILMRFVPGELVAWTSAESASVRHTGSALFENAPNGTRMTLRLTYDPPLGFVGQQIAKIFGADPKRELEEDLVRFKSLLERGKVTGARGTVTEQQLVGATPAQA